ATGAEWESTGATSFTPAVGDPAVAPSSRMARTSRHSDGPRVLGLDEAIELARVDASRLGASVLIGDDSGTYAPLGLAEALATAGASVRFFTARNEIGTEPAFHLELPHLLPRLRVL